MFPKTTFAAALTACSLLSVAPSMAETIVGSWNVQHLGWENEKDIAAVARIVSAFDLITLQEVMSATVLDELEREVETLTGEDWQVMSSDAIGRGSYRERYAFLWRTSEVSWVDGAVVYIDDRDAFAREPMSMRFESADNYRFVLASVHLIYGEDVAEREREANALASYQAWLKENFGDTPIYIAGDFNLPPGNSAWSALGAGSSPLITDGATTLSPVDDRFVNLYDNIWVPAGNPIPVSGSGILNFPDLLELSHQEARDHVSDHAPVWMRLDMTSSHVTYKPHVPGGVPARGTSGHGTKKAAASQSGSVQGNRNSKIYHRAGCPGYDKMARNNMVFFGSETEAQRSGYRIARNCH